MTEKMEKEARLRKYFEEELSLGLVFARESKTISEAAKQAKTGIREADRNKSVKSGVKTAIKKVYAAVEANDKEAAKTALVAATSALDKAAKKGVYHKNTSARKISRLAVAVNKMA